MPLQLDNFVSNRTAATIKTLKTNHIRFICITGTTDI